MIVASEKQIEEKWLIEGFPEYFIGSDNCVYHRQNQHVIKMVMKKYTKGFYLHRRFYSLHALRKLLRRL